MKKLLALVLALVMTLGLATVGSNAAFTDADSINNKEAVDVMSAIGVLAGMDNGSFNPAGTLTREQGAKIITYMLLGPTAADALVAPKAPFSDVAADRWSAGSIAYCVSEGIIAGVGDGKFDPTGSLTGYAFAKMCLVALGYRADMEGLTGADWSLNTATMIRKLDLASGISAFVGSNTMTREAAAQMGFNTLTSTEVYYDTTSSVSSDGTSSIGTKTRTTNVTNTSSTYNGGVENTMQLCEDVFPKLKLTTTTDDFGNPVNKWTYGAETVSTAANKSPIVSYTDKLNSTDATNRTLFGNDVTGYSVTSAAYKLNGVTKTALTTKDAIADVLKTGRFVQVYANSNNEINYVSAVDTFVAKISSKDVSNKTVDLTVYVGGTGYTVQIEDKVTDANYDFYAELSALKKGDYVLVYAHDADEAIDSTAIVLLDVLGAPETVTGEYTSYASGKYTVGGVARKASVTSGTTLANAGSITLGGTYDLLLDTYGNILKADLTTTSKNYAYVLDTTTSGNPVTGETFYKKLLFSDGTVAWANVTSYNGVAATSASAKANINNVAAGDFVTYTKDGDNYDVIEVASTWVRTTAADKIGTVAKNVALFDTAGTDTAMSNSTVLLVYHDNTNTADVYTGLAKMPNLTSTAGGVLMTGAGSGAAKMIVMTATAAVAKKDAVLIYKSAADAVKTDADSGYTVTTYKAIVDGKITKVDVADDTAGNATDGIVAVAKDGLYVGNFYHENGFIENEGAKINSDDAANKQILDNGTSDQDDRQTLTTWAATNKADAAVYYLAAAGAGDIILKDGVLTVDDGTTTVTAVTADDFTTIKVTNIGASGAAAEYECPDAAGAGNDEIAVNDVVYFGVNDDGYVVYMIWVDVA